MCISNGHIIIKCYNDHLFQITLNDPKVIGQTQKSLKYALWPWPLSYRDSCRLHATCYDDHWCQNLIKIPSCTTKLGFGHENALWPWPFSWQYDSLTHQVMLRWSLILHPIISKVRHAWQSYRPDTMPIHAHNKHHNMPFWY